MLVVGAAAFAVLAYVYLTLPDVRPLASRNPTTTAWMDMRRREARLRDAERRPRHEHRWVTYSRISPHLKQAVIVAEDSAFWDHEGIDLEQIRESMEVNLEKLTAARGASTITQQLAKNLYLSPSRNPIRKLRELIIARRMEATLSKSRIFEIYLNVIEWGDGIWGAEAAARRYFGVPASSVSPPQAALLAAAIINPRLLNPARPTPRLLRRQRIIMRRMGAVTPPPAPSPPTESLPPVVPGEPAPVVADEPPAEPALPEPAPPVPCPVPPCHDR